MNPINLDCITVCVDYAKYLELTVGNRSAFNRWLIVTIERDTETIAVCKKYDLEYYLTERLYESGPFCKGRAINDGIMHLQPQDWVCVVDADLYLFSDTFRKCIESVDLDRNNLYGLCGRLLVQDGEELKRRLALGTVRQEELDVSAFLVGYFQMWHISMRPTYPEESPHAGWDDIHMRDGYDEGRRFLFPMYGIHIGDLWVNHKGVQAPLV